MVAYVALAVSLMSMCAALLAVGRAKQLWQQASSCISATKRSIEVIELVESFESRMSTLEARYESVAKRAHLNARRDPATGLSVRQAPKVETKDDLKRRLGLVGANAARAAHLIHSSGGATTK